MSTSKRVLICVGALVGPYLSVLVFAFVLGTFNALTVTPYTEGQQNLVYFLAEFSLLAGLVLCPYAIYATRKRPTTIKVPAIIRQG